MSFADERQAIEARLSTNWTSTPIKYDNVSFSAPSDNKYISVVIANGASSQQELGASPMHRHIGLITIQIFVPVEAGTNVPRDYADSLATVFRNAQFSAGSSGTILCRSPSIVRVGVTNGLYQLNVAVPYQRDVTYT